MALHLQLEDKLKNEYQTLISILDTAEPRGQSFSGDSDNAVPLTALAQSAMYHTQSSINSVQFCSNKNVTESGDDIFATGIRIRPRNLQPQLAIVEQGIAQKRFRIQSKLQVRSFACSNKQITEVSFQGLHQTPESVVTEVKEIS